MGDVTGQSIHDLKKLGRLELLDILVELSKENEHLQAENAQLSRTLQDRTIAIKNAGSLAEAALAVNGFFADAQAAANQYRECAQQTLADAQAAARIIQDAHQKADHIIREASHTQGALGEKPLHSRVLVSEGAVCHV
ncbi:MAG: hypothetical protein ACOX4F_00490 [Atopobiaceae bacterium]